MYVASGFNFDLFGQNTITIFGKKLVKGELIYEV
jgi:hypothetical protein